MENNEEGSKKPRTKKRLIITAAAAVAAIVLLAGGFYGYLYASTPSHMRNPAFDHYHFRTQILVNGKAVDFSADKFQQQYDSGSCSAELSGQPIDFHDNIDQMTHIHWDGVTGGEFLKYYGWNFIGGDDNSLGRRFDQGLMNMHHVSTFGSQLPDVPENANFYVYIGDENGYEKKSWDNFLNQDLEDFFGKKSSLSQDEQASLLERLFMPKAYAHGGVMDGHSDEEGEKTEEELTRINNLIGNVVIFAQESEPTDEQVAERFASLVPLQDSTCGG